MIALDSIRFGAVVCSLSYRGVATSVRRIIVLAVKSLISFLSYDSHRFSGVTSASNVPSLRVPLQAIHNSLLVRTLSSRISRFGRMARWRISSGGSFRSGPQVAECRGTPLSHNREPFLLSREATGIMCKDMCANHENETMFSRQGRLKP